MKSGRSIIAYIMFQFISHRVAVVLGSRSSLALFACHRRSFNNSLFTPKYSQVRKKNLCLLLSDKGYWVPPEITTPDDDEDDTPKTFREDFQGTRVFVEGLPKSSSWQDVKDHFRDCIGEVVFASVSIDDYGESKGCGIVQFETVDSAKLAIKNMRNYPMEGSTLYVRPDRQERSKRRGARNESYGRQRDGRSNNKSVWRCGNEDNSSLISEKDREFVEHMINRRDKARLRKDFGTADRIREELKFDFGVHIDDRLKMWWNAVDGVNAVPDSIVQLKGDGNWKGPKPWRQIPTTPENDLCVNSELVEGLLKQRDIARLEKDFRTADMLLEQARSSPEGNNLQLRIHDESRTWRVWTEEKPQFSESRFERNPPNPRDKCIEYIREVDPNKEAEVTNLLDKFPGREWNVMKKLKQRYG